MKILYKLSNLDISQIRNDFPILDKEVNGSRLVYLDNAATTQRPDNVIEAVKNFCEETNSNIHRGVHTLSYNATRLYEEAHEKVADFVGAESWKEIIFTRNATEAINLVAYGWGLHNLEKGDEIVITITEHHSNIVPWQMLRDLKGVTLKYLDVDDEGNLITDNLEEIITNNTKLVCINHISNVLGTINPVKEVTRAARNAGAIVLVDGAQSAPHYPVNVNDLDCDFFAASGHKMLAPFGIGFLYGRSELLESMQPFNYGGDMIETVTMEESTWNELPWKFEAGTPNVSGGVGLGAAVDYLNSLGMSEIAEYEHELTKYAASSLGELPFIQLYGPPGDQKIGVYSFNVEGVHPHDVAWILDENGIAVRSGHHCAQPLMRRLGIKNAVRASFYFYNTFDEIDRLVDALYQVKKTFRR